MKIAITNRVTIQVTSKLIGDEQNIGRKKELLERKIGEKCKKD